MLADIQGSCIDEWMWRRIIDKMYDPTDSHVLEQRFSEQIRQREEIANLVSAGLSLGHTHFQPSETVTEQQITQFLVQNKINVHQARRLSRDEILALFVKNQGKLTYADFSKTILDFQLEEH